MLMQAAFDSFQKESYFLFLLHLYKYRFSLYNLFVRKLDFCRSLKGEAT